MKCRHALVISFVCLGVFVLVMLARQRSAHKPHSKIWRAFCKDKGFLIHEGIGADSYSKAVETLAESGFEKTLFGKNGISEPNLIINDTIMQEFTDLVIQGAKMERFGTEVPKLVGSDVYTSGGEIFPINKVASLTKALAHIAGTELRYKGNIERAILLGTANIALGTQLSDFSDNCIRMYGVACKSGGLRTLEECAACQENEELKVLVETMRPLVQDEFRAVRRASPQPPSFWDMFVECIKSGEDSKVLD